MLIELDYRGQSARKLVEVTKEEYQKIKKLEESFYLTDTEEGRELLKDLEQRPNKGADIPVVIAYA